MYPRQYPAPEVSQRHLYFAVAAVFGAIPLVVLQNGILGFRPSGWAWLLVMAATAPIVITEPINLAALRPFLPYFLYLIYAVLTLVWTDDIGRGVQTIIQLTVPAGTYLLGWRLARDPNVSRLIFRLSASILAVFTVATLATGGSRIQPLGLALSRRPASIAVILLFVVVAGHLRTIRQVLLVWALCLGLTALMGSRMASAVLVVMLLTSPKLTKKATTRVFTTAVCVAVVLALSQTATFRERFFFTDDATLTDVLTLDKTVNTAGRRELWPQMLKACGEKPLLGHGIGASEALSLRFTNGLLTHPHNDYIGTYCNTGLIGSLLFWGFFVRAAGRSLSASRRKTADSVHAIAWQLSLAFLLLAITDNPFIYTAHFMAPFTLLLGCSDRTMFMRHASSRAPARAKAPIG